LDVIERIPVAVTRRAQGLSKQAFYAWKNNPLSRRDWGEADLINTALDIRPGDPAFWYRFIVDEPAQAGAQGQREPGGSCVLSSGSGRCSPGRVA
jgi:putative transposase